jgi:hypothetical protein
MNPTVGEDGRYEVVRTSDDRRLDEATRTLVLRRDRYRCVFCGKGGRLEADHIIPWSAGGSDDLDNLRTLCHECNQERSNFSVPGDDWRRLPTAHECVYCNRGLLGEPGVTPVYCIVCNKKAPGLPLNRTEAEPEIYYAPDDAFDDPKRHELDALAARYRADALRTIRAAIQAES